MKINGLAFCTILLTYVLIVFGGYVASSNSGMGCGPDWPLCNGVVIPVLKGATLIEFAHRVIGAFLGIVTGILFLKIMRSNPDYFSRSVAWGMIFLLIVQILLGAFVVVLDLPAIIISIHLLIAMFFLASLIWIWRNSSMEEPAVYSNKSLSNDKRKLAVLHLNTVLVLLVLTLGFGGYIKHQSYGLSCGWLGCGNSIFPASFPEILQTVHRFLGAASAIYIFVLLLWSFIKKWGSPIQNRLMIASITVLVQLLIGVITVVSNIEIPWAVLHLAVGTALFAIVYEARVYAGAYQMHHSQLRVLPSGKKPYQRWNLD